MIEALTMSTAVEDKAIFIARDKTNNVYSLKYVVLPFSRKNEVADINAGTKSRTLESLGVKLCNNMTEALAILKE